MNNLSKPQLVGNVSEGQAYMPALPDEIKEALKLHQDTPNEWLQCYVEYASTRSPLTPMSFHQSAGLALLSAVIARRIKIDMTWGPVYPNLYILWVAPTTIYHKTTAMQITREIMDEVAPHLLMAEDSTPEAMFSHMSGAKPVNLDTLSTKERQRWEASRRFAAQKMWMIDEFSGFMAGANRQYNAGQQETFLKLYDCPNELTRSTQKQGLQTVQRPYPVILSASTPSAMQPYFADPILWSNGWWPRFIIITPEAPPAWQESAMIERPDMLIDKLQALDMNLPQPKEENTLQTIDAKLSDEAMRLFTIYAKAMIYDLLLEGELDDRLAGVYGRMPTHTAKVAALLAATEWDGTGHVTIEVHHFVQALRITETWRAGAHRLLQQATQSKVDQMVEKVVNQIAQNGEKGMTLRDVSLLN